MAPPLRSRLTGLDRGDTDAPLAMADQMPRIVIGDGALYYERQGIGFPVMFVSGLAGFASFWGDQVAAFAKNFDVITHDHRGIEQPKRLASVVLSATWTKPDAYFRRLFGLRKDILLRLGPSAYVQANTLFLYPSWWVARNNERLRQQEAQHLAVFPPTEIAASRIDAILAFDRTESLLRIKTPTLVVGAEDDIVTPAYFSEELARLIPGAEIKIFPRGGHAFTQVRAREFTQAVLPFLASHTPG